MDKENVLYTYVYMGFSGGTNSKEPTCQCRRRRRPGLDPVVTIWNCTLPGSSVYGILQTRILEWVAKPSSRGSSPSRDWTHISCLLHWQIDSLPLVPLGKPNPLNNNSPFFPPSAPGLLSDSTYCLTILGTSYRWNHTIQYLPTWVWFTLLSIMSSRFLHVEAYVKNSLLFKAQ